MMAPPELREAPFFCYFSCELISRKWSALVMTISSSLSKLALSNIIPLVQQIAKVIRIKHMLTIRVLQED